MSPVTRRGALSLVPAAVASVAAPLAVSAAPAEHPGDRVVRLMRELREALSDPAGMNGQFMAEVHPHGHPGSIALEDVGWRAKRIASAERASRYFAMLDDMEPRERQRHYAQKLRQALFEQRPGEWRISHVEADGKPDVVMLVFHPNKPRARNGV